jgi:hypothetical protein
MMTQIASEENEIMEDAYSGDEEYYALIKVLPYRTVICGFAVLVNLLLL